jgi:hypothetical protein
MKISSIRKKTGEKPARPALSNLEGDILLIPGTDPETGVGTTAGSLLWNAHRWSFTPGFITIRLQPQMKKYRSLWYKSTTNHNI